MNVVLIPGILGFNRIGPVSYFNGIPEHLRRIFPHLQVLATRTAPLGTIERRSNLLANQIREALAAGTLDPTLGIHLIAHSMGGLDARHLITHIHDVADRVSTLVSIATPHLGTPLATALENSNPLHVVRELFGLRGAVIDELLAHTDALHDLSEESMRGFNTDCPNNSRVRYFNVVGAGRDALFQTSALFAPTHLYLSALVGRNDGIVPLASAVGDCISPIQWAGDHADLIGHNLDEPAARDAPAFDYLRAYENLIHTITRPGA